MEMQAVAKSSSVKEIGWEDNILAVRYVAGVLWHYWPVPKEVHDVIMSSTSKGHSVDALIKKFVPARYQSKQVKG